MRYVKPVKDYFTYRTVIYARNIDGTTDGCEKPELSFEEFFTLSIDSMEGRRQGREELQLTCLKPDVYSGLAGDRPGIRFYAMHYMRTEISRRHFNQLKARQR